MMTVKELKDFLATEFKDNEDVKIYGTFNEDDFFAPIKISSTMIGNEQLIYLKF